METINVALDSRSYPIYIEHGLLDRVGQFFNDMLGKHTVAIITDDNVAPLYLERVENSFARQNITTHSIVLPHGEQTKCLRQLEHLYTFLAEAGITRTDAIVALGGGVIGDLTGLAAATWLRGVKFVQIPTTLLAQVDSSVGGKVAVDLPFGKNLVGAFWQPSLVLVDPETLNTLTDEYWRDGLGEVIKYGCINDEALFILLEECAAGGRDGLMQKIDTILMHCIQAKADVVREDELDTGLRMTLNFGHTVAHAIETVEHYQGMRHGEAVALGMLVITHISESEGMTEAGTLQRLIALEKQLGFSVDMPALPEADLLTAMHKDKKNAGSKLTVVLIKKIGSCFLHKTTADFFAGKLGGIQ